MKWFMAVWFLWKPKQYPIANERVIIRHVKLGYYWSKFNYSRYTRASKQLDQISFLISTADCTYPTSHNDNDDDNADLRIRF